MCLARTPDHWLGSPRVGPRVAKAPPVSVKKIRKHRHACPILIESWGPGHGSDIASRPPSPRPSPHMPLLVCSTEAGVGSWVARWVGAFFMLEFADLVRVCLCMCPVCACAHRTSRGGRMTWRSPASIAHCRAWGGGKEDIKKTPPNCSSSTHPKHKQRTHSTHDQLHPPPHPHA